MHWPLKTLATNMGFSIQQLQRYEAGTNKISASLLYRMAQEFKTDITSFYEGYKELSYNAHSNHSYNNILLIEKINDDEILFRKALAD